MKLDKMLEHERRQLDRFSLLPHRFKRIGLIVTILSFGLFFILPKESESLLLGRSLAGKICLIGLLLIAVSKERNEDERTGIIRMQSYMAALVAGVIYAVIQPYINYFVGTILKPGETVFEDLNTFIVLWFMLVIQICFFYLLKRTS